MTKRAIIYARLSPTPRNEEAKGGNLDQQVDLCQKRCDAEGWQVVATFAEKDTSATSTKVRKDWENAVGMVEAGEADIIVSRHYDRMYRKVADLTKLIELANKTGVELVATEAHGQVDLSSATGRGNAYYMAVGAQLETEIKAERQKLGHQRRIAAGRPFWGTRPFGFEKDGEHRQDEAERIKQAYSDVLAGHTLWGIAARWNAEGVQTRTGTDWRTNTVRQVLLHPRNAGVHTYNPERVTRPASLQASGYEATWDGIVSPEIFEAAHRLLTDPARNTGGGGKRKGLLTGIATCASCDGPLGQSWNKVRTDGSRLRKYSCRSCRSASIPADFLDDVVINRIVMKAPQIVAAKLATGEESDGLGAGEIDSLRAEKVSLGTKKSEYIEDFNAEYITREDMRRGIASANGRIAEIDATLTDNAVNRISASRWSDDIESMFAALDDLDDPVTHDRLREIITDATTHIRVLPRGKGKRQPALDDVDIRLVGGIEIQ